MKKLLTLFLLMTFISYGYAQKRKDMTSQLDINGTLNAKYEDYPKGANVKLMGVTKLKSRSNPDLNGVQMITAINGTQVAIPTSKANLLDLHPETIEDFWAWTFIKNGMYNHYNSKGYRYQLRKEITDEAASLLQETAYAHYTDAYILDYLRTIFIGIIPQNLNNNRRPEVPNIEVLTSPAPDSYMYPNGTLVITTGLLSTLDSVEELTAIIACEVAHYVLDHHLINVAKEMARARRAEFWGPILQELAFATEEIFESDKASHVAGGILISSLIGTAAIAIEISGRLGMSYTKGQVKQADRTAIEFLEFAGMDPSALASALTKIRDYYRVEREYATLYQGDLKDLDNRIKQVGSDREICEFQNRYYLKTMAEVTTQNALIYQDNKNYPAAERLVNKNIQHNLATVNDYVISIQASMNQSNSPEANLENLQFIREINEKSLVPNLQLNKLEILLLLRLEEEAEASNALKAYVQTLQEYQKQTDSGSEFDWAATEIQWANNLYQRITRF